MHLFMVHCGFYDTEVCDGLYESHVNFFVVAEDFQQARIKAKEHSLYQGKKMHIDGLQQLEAIEGFRVILESDASLEGKSRVRVDRYRGLAQKTAPRHQSLH